MKFILCETYGTSKHIPPEAKREETGDVFPYYSIEINSVEELLRLADITVDGIVVYKSQASFETKIAPYIIEIYDGYRE